LILLQRKGNIKTRRKAGFGYNTVETLLFLPYTTENKKNKRAVTVNIKVVNEKTNENGNDDDNNSNNTRKPIKMKMIIIIIIR
jgi:hypothetical protein